MKCLRCGAGREWIEEGSDSTVPNDPRPELWFIDDVGEKGELLRIASRVEVHLNPDAREVARAVFLLVAEVRHLRGVLAKLVMELSDAGPRSEWPEKYRKVGDAVAAACVAAMKTGPNVKKHVPGHPGMLPRDGGVI